MAKRKKNKAKAPEAEVVTPEVEEVLAEEAAPEDEGKKAPPTVNPREAAMELAAQRRNAAVNADLEEANSAERVDTGEVISESEETDPEKALVEEVVEEVDPPVTEEITEAAAPPALPAGDVVSITLEDGTTIQVPASAIQSTIKVDGAESQVSLEDLRRNHQKSLAADNRLKEAAELKKDLERQFQEQPPNAGVVPSAPPVDSDVQARVEKTVNALYSGDVDEAKAALEGLVKATAVTPAAPQAAPSVDAIAADVEARLDTRSAGRMFAKDFSEIVADPFLMQRADAFADEVANEDKSLSKLEIFQEAGARTRQWIADLTGTAPAGEETPVEETVVKIATTTGMETRRERKSATVRSLPVSGKIAGLGAPKAAPVTNSSVIAEMKKSRGQ